MTTQLEEKLSHAEQNAQAWMEQITAAQEAYEFCAEEGEGKDLSREAKALLHELNYDGTNHQAVAEDIEQQNQEAPLSVSVRSGWQSPGEELEAAEFQILLSWGGPALRIVGELNQYGEPEACRLQHQDWGTPWTEWLQADRDALQWFAGFFYFQA